MCISLCALSLAACGADQEELTKQGMEAVARQEYRSARDSFDRALNAGGDKEQIYRGIGLSYMGQQDYAKALSSFSKALKEAGPSPGEMEFDINYYMAICHYKLGEYDAAIGCYDAITELKRKETRAWYLKGSMKLYLNDVKGAVEDFDTAVSVKKGDYSLYIDIYDSMLQHGYNAEAQKYLDVVLAADVKDIGDYDKGRLCYFRGEYGQACNYLERARSEGKVDSGLITLLGECYKRQDQYDYAAVVYGGYVDDFGDAAICNQLGLCYVEQGDYENGLAAFRRGREIRENNTCLQALRLNEIVCLEHLGQYKEAAKELSDYMETYGDSELLNKEYAFLITR
ncbi:MAG: tetratricopeptide repeat protein [Lachnospiraceae bacterium]|nr:tetratricopeptide repeat protein [Lachnospiraceae bacterium]